MQVSCNPKRYKRMKNIIIVTIIALFNLNNSVAQWTKINALPTQHIVALTVFGDTILAATDANLLYKSVDGGNNWSSIVVSNNPIVIITLKVIDNKIYVGTNSDGVFTSADYGLTWLNTGSNLLAVSGIENKGTDTYAATLGEGVYIFDQGINNWIPFNDSLPSYSVNVFTILGTANSLLIGAGSNGTFYRYHFNTHSWNEEYYYGILFPGLQIAKLINNSDTIFAVNGNKIIRSEDDGLNWTDDKIGSHDGANRTINAGASTYYTLTNLFAGGTWIQQRSKGSASGTTWATNEEFLPDGYSYDLLEFQNKLFLAKADGLYTRDLLQGVNNPLNNETDVKIFPNPSDASAIHISGDNQVNKFTIATIPGQVLYSENVGKNEFTIQPNLTPGVYLINLTLSNGQNVIKKLIVK